MNAVEWYMIAALHGVSFDLRMLLVGVIVVERYVIAALRSISSCTACKESVNNR